MWYNFLVDITGQAWKGATNITEECVPFLMGWKIMIEEEMNILIEKALAAGEFPVGAIIVREGKILSSAYNRIESDKDVTGHAEILAIKKAVEVVGDWRLEDCELHCALEPCEMCKEVIRRSRIKKVFYYTEKTYKKGFETKFLYVDNPEIKQAFVQKTKKLFGRYEK